LNLNFDLARDWEFNKLGSTKPQNLSLRAG